MIHRKDGVRRMRERALRRTRIGRKNGGRTR